MELKKTTFKYIESELYYYPDTMKEINLLRDQIINNKNGFDENVGGGRSSHISDPTGNIAIRLTTHKQLKHLEVITNAINKVYIQLPEDYQKLIKMKYWTKPQLKTLEGIGLEINVSRDKAYRMRKEIISALALELGYR